jgi:hypothetical protein
VDVGKQKPPPWRADQECLPVDHSQGFDPG